MTNEFVRRGEAVEAMVRELIEMYPGFVKMYGRDLVLSKFKEEVDCALSSVIEDELEQIPMDFTRSLRG
jgi:hypothetical protein